VKKTVIIFLMLLVAFAGGTYYGYTTGFKDGHCFGQTLTLGVIEDYGANPGSTKLTVRGDLVDRLASNSAYLFADSYSYSPLAPFVRRHVDAALLRTAAYWELNAREQKSWSEEMQRPLFPNGSKEAARLDRLKQQEGAYYEGELKRQEMKRQARASSKGDQR
jgi:hypothetical protein